MSREPDSSSSGPRRGHDGAPLPSGNPPYEPPEPEEGARAAAKPEEPKTETTLTTRIRINIPGSRPIPPVVMRTPVGEEGAPVAGKDDDGTPRGAGQDPEPGAGAAAGARAEDGADDGETGGKKPTEEPKPKASDWFAPRKPVKRAAPPPGDDTGVPPGGPPFPGPPPTVDHGPELPPYLTDNPAANPPIERPDTGIPSFDGGSPADRGYDFGADTTALGFGVDPGGHRFDTDTPSDTPADTPLGGFRTEIPPYEYDSDIPPDDLPGGPADPFAGRRSGGGRHAGPAKPTTGPVTGDLADFGARPPTPSRGTPGAGGLDAAAETDQLDLNGGLFRAPAPSSPPEDPVSGETLVSGVPVIPPAEERPASPFPGGGRPGSGGGGPGATSSPTAAVGSADQDVEQATDGGAKPPAPPAASGGRPVRKGRSKLTLAGVVLAVLVGAAYVAGLVMNHADVPNGTTVLGVDIGGSSKETAVDKLNAALGDRTRAPLKISVEGHQRELRPSVAGLALDTETTVRNVAGRDYNPVTVIGSLFGSTHDADPDITVDQEKLRNVLEREAGNLGSAREGSITFEPGRVVPVYGRQGKALDLDKAVKAVSDAYRDRAATGVNRTVTLPVGTRRPTVSNAEVDRVMKSFAKPAMSGLVTIRTDAAHQVPFGPDKSLPKILSVRAEHGKLVPHYDLTELKKLYGSTFDGVTITEANGTKRSVTPQDVADALRKALLGTTPAQRVGTIDTHPK